MKEPSRLPMMITILILAVLIGVAIKAITPEKNTPLVTGDQVEAPLTPAPGLEAGGGDVEGLHNNTKSAAPNTGTEGESEPVTP